MRLEHLRRVAGRIAARAQYQRDAGKRIVAPHVPGNREVKAWMRIFADGPRLGGGHQADDPDVPPQVGDAPPHGILLGKGLVGEPPG